MTRHSQYSSSIASRISADGLRNKLEQLKTLRTRSSTYENYYKIWKCFNKFLITLDYIPEIWEERLVLFCVHMINKGTQSSTLKSYISAIKGILKDDNYVWQQEMAILNTLTRACKVVRQTKNQTTNWL